MEQESHTEIISHARKDLGEIFEESEQSIYIYLDDANKVCNERFANLLGYKSPKEWASVKGNFPEVFVAPKDRGVLVSAYQDAMRNLVGSVIHIEWRKKDGGKVSTRTILVPIVVDGHRMALHFISPP